ncbi:MAG: YdeI/OmpD-associated family protein [Prevotella sp.]|nr:YdeI/OmpD-associated family protein [Prevotella sp.]
MLIYPTNYLFLYSGSVKEITFHPLIAKPMFDIINKKLALQKFEKKAIIHCPNSVKAFDGLLYDQEYQATRYDLIIHFVYTLNEFKDILCDTIKQERLNPNGVIYFAYPKKGNKRYDKFIGRDEFFTIVDMNADGYVGDSPIKFNKMVSLDDTFTIIGLKHDTQPRHNTQPSQCVSAYVERIPELVRYIKSYPDVLKIFKALTPGYQRGWARYVYAVKSEATQEKHLQEMIMILRAGFKSIDLYRQRK